ncbi:MAG TPA: helix-turn-helix domain-containing protein [Chthoniobacterales bacterium]|jgi:AraC-like DNA-binding protein/ligand-binding sensor protein
MKTTDADLIQRLSRSDLYTEFKQAFAASTGLPLTLRPQEFWHLAHSSQPHENPFCAMITQTNRGCAACLEVEQRAVDAAQDRSATVHCFAGLCHTAVPVKLGERTIGFLQTGQVALDVPSAARFEGIARQLIDWEVPVDLKRLEDAYYRSRVLSPDQYAGLIRLLEIFGQQLSAVANRMTVQDAEAEPPMIRRAKAYIADHYGDPTGLDDIAHALHVSTFYFCKMFKKATGLTFTDYLGRVRVEKAKNLLLNPHLRVSEIAYTVGFQSLTHFNRTFRKITGEAPTAFRENGTCQAKSMARNRGAWRSAPEADWPGAMHLAA